MIETRRIIRITRFVLIAAALGMVWVFSRDSERYTIPVGDESLAPDRPGGTTVAVRMLDDDAPLEVGMDVVYAMEREGTEYARFGRVRALPGDVVGSVDGWIAVNGEPIFPFPMRGNGAGRVPEGSAYILAIWPEVGDYVDSRELGFIPRAQVRAEILAKVP